MILEDVILGFGLGFFSAIFLLVIREIVMSQMSIKKEVETNEKPVEETERRKLGDKDKTRIPNLP